MPTSEGHYTSKCASPVNDTPELVILVPFLALCPSPCLLWMTTIAGDGGANLYTNPSAQLLLPAIAFLTLSSLDSPATWHTPPPADHVPRDEVRTLFIAGLPDDVKPREIYNLFREFPGYQSAQLRRSGQSSQVRIFFSFPPIVLLTYLFIVSRGIRIYCFYRPTVSTFCNACSKSDDGVSYCYDKRVRGSVAYSRGFSDSGNDNHSLHV
ncbi:hypothetical protein GW17_00049054 [Ensete ventricosum]|nr:hypothetical protein GW17_00049054 [Ensete ventricosum]